MARPHPGDRYSGVSILLHWLMLLLIVAVYAAIEFREFFPKGSEPREALKLWHFMLGLSVLGLVWLLYVFMIGMPVAGWLILSAEGEPIPFFGLELPALVGTNDQLADQVEGIHELGGTIGYWLVGLHAAASLFHQYILRDRTFARMIPIGA